MSKEPRDFQAELLDWRQIHELPDGWPAARYLALLAELEIDGITEGDAAEVALMALQDLDHDDAAEHVLKAVFGDGMRPGVRQNLAHDLTEERPWEDFADLSQQSGIFNAVVLLQRAFPREYGKPDAVSLTVRLATASGKGAEWLAASAPDPALLLRILAAGMDDRAVLRRLFDEALEGERFPEAGAILWRVAREADPRTFRLVSSHQWLDPLQKADTWTAKAWKDASPG